MIPKQTTLSYKGGVWDMDVMPWFYQPRQSVLRPLPSLVNESLTYGGVLAQCYLYCRGSTDLHVYHAADSPLVKTSAFITDLTDGDETEHVACTPLVDSSSGALHVRVPSYQMVPRMSTQAFHEQQWSPQFSALGTTLPNQFASAVDGHDYGPTVLPRLRFSYLSKIGLSNAILKRSAGDDALLGHYMGPVPLAYTELPDPDFPTKVTVEFQSGFPTAAIPDQSTEPVPPEPIPGDLKMIRVNTSYSRSTPLEISNFVLDPLNYYSIWKIEYVRAVPPDVTTYFSGMQLDPAWKGLEITGWNKPTLKMRIRPTLEMGSTSTTLYASFRIGVWVINTALGTLADAIPPWGASTDMNFVVNTAGVAGLPTTINEVLAQFPASLTIPVMYYVSNTLRV